MAESINQLRKKILSGNRDTIYPIYKFLIRERGKYLNLFIDLYDLALEKLKDNSEDPFWLLMQGTSLYFFYRRDESNDIFNKLIKKNNEYLIEAYNFQCVYLITMVRSNNNIDYEKFIKYAAKALELNALKKEYDFLDEAEFCTAFAYQVNLFGSSNVEKAIYHYERVINHTKDINFLSFSYLNLSVFWSEQGQYKKAIEYVKRSLKYRDSSLARTDLAAYLYQVGSRDEAIKRFENTIEELEDLVNSGKTEFSDEELNDLRAYAICCYRLAVHYSSEFVARKSYKKTDGYLKKALKTKLPYAYLNASNLYGILNKCKEEFDTLKEGFENALYEDVDLINDYGVLVLNGVDDYVEGDTDKAISIFERASKYNNCIALYNLGVCYEINEDYLEAIKYYQKSYEEGYIEAKNSIEEISSLLNKKTSMSEYAQSLNDEKLSGVDLYNKIKKDLVEDFGECYFKLTPHIVDSFVLGIYSFVMYTCLPNSSNIDYSSSSVSISKGFESFLYHVVIKPYVDYLQKNHVDPHTVNPSLTYENDKGELQIGIPKFSIGAYKHYVGTQEYKKPYAIDGMYIEYINSISKPGSNSAYKFVYDFVLDITKIRDIRNSASHKGAVSRIKAEELINYIIKEKKIVLKYLKRML